MLRCVALSLSLAAVGLVLLGFDPSASAADQPVSTVRLAIDPSRVQAVLELPLAALCRAMGRGCRYDGGPSTAGPSAEDVAGYLGEHVHLAYAADGLPWAPIVDSVSLVRADGRVADRSRAIVAMSFRRPEAYRAQALELTDDAIVHRVSGHRIVVSVGRDLEQGVLFADDEPATVVGILSDTRRTLTLLRTEASLARGMAAVFRLGLADLAARPAQLTLLVLLFLTAPLVALHGRWRGLRTARGTALALAKIGGGFTVGSVLALVASRSDLAAPRTGLLDVLGTASLVVLGLHLWRPVTAAKNGVALAVPFGALHGFAFAAALPTLSMQGGAGALSLVMLAFAVVCAEAIAMGLVLPWLLLLREPMLSPLAVGLRLATGFVAGVSVLALGVDRLSGSRNVVTRLLRPFESATFSGRGAELALALTLVPLAAFAVAAVQRRRARSTCPRDTWIATR